MYKNLVDAVSGHVFEGKSYKRNDDDEIKSKKEKDQERKDAAKNKKQPVDEALGDGMTDAAKIKTLRGLIKKCKEAAIEHSDKPAKSAQYEKQVAKYEKELAEIKAKKPVAEDMRPSEVKPVAGSPLVGGGRVSGHTLQPGFMFRVITGPLSKKDQFCARVKEIEGVKWVYLIDQHGDQDWYKADDVFPTKISLRKADATNRARFTSMTEGKSFKRNKDEDADEKKKEDKQKRDAKKSEPVAEGYKEQSTANLIKRRSTIAKHMDNLQFANDQALDGQTGSMRRMVIDSDDFRGRDDRLRQCRGALAVLDGEIAKRKAGGSSVAEAEELTYAEQDLINELRDALGKLWKISGDKKFVPDAVKANAKKAFMTSHASRATLAHALRDLWKHSDKDLAPHDLKSAIFRTLSKSGIQEETIAVDESAFEEDEDHAGSLDEAYGRGWAILPATVALYGKKVVDIHTAASEWKSDKHPTSILVCHKNENGRDRMLFLSTASDARGHYKVGQSNETYHDQTGASKGVYTVLNIVVFQDGEIIHQENDKGLTGKASVAVFK